MFSSLPASGKSESHHYLKSLWKEQTEKFLFGETSTQVDDYQYVDPIRKIDEATNKTLGFPNFLIMNQQCFSHLMIGEP